MVILLLTNGAISKHFLFMAANCHNEADDRVINDESASGVRCLLIIHLFTVGVVGFFKINLKP